MELAVWLLLSTLFITAIDWIGSDTLANLIYAPFAPAAKATRTKKAEILQLRADLAATSSQDEFSKWARIRRKLDKAVQDLEASNADTAAHRKKFAATFKSALWLATTVLPFIASSWHRKSPVFWLPRGWFGPLGWWLSFPSAPAGAVAVSVWTMACRRTLSSVKTAVVALVPTPAERTAEQLAKAQGQPATGEKVKVGVTAAGAEERIKEL
ncbi:GET complex subunit get1 [Rhodotorula kratochvilovae]